MNIKNQSVSLQQKKLNNAFLKAVNQKDFKKMQEFLDKGADINTRDVDGRTALMYMCETGSWNDVKFFLDRKADISLSDPNGMMATHYAARNKNTETLNQWAMLPYVNMKRGDRTERTPLWHAIDASLPENVDICLYYDEPNADEYGLNGDTLITKAARKDRSVDLIERLLMYSVNGVNSHDSSGNSLLQIALQKNDKPLCDYLLRYKDINVNTYNLSHFSPLMQAALNGDEKMVKALLQRGADVKCVDNFGNNVMIYAVQGENAQVVDMLASYGADLNCENKKGLFPLTVAAQARNYKLFEQLYRLGANVNAVNKRGKSIADEYAVATHSDLKDDLRFRRINVRINSDFGEELTPVDSQKGNSDQSARVSEYLMNAEKKGKTLSKFTQVPENSQQIMSNWSDQQNSSR